MEVLGRGTGDLLELLKSEIQPGGTIGISIRGPVPDRVRLAVLSWAFLAAFEQYGYAFALQPATRTVRKTLIHPPIQVMPSMAFSRPDRATFEAGKISLIVAIHMNPPQVRLIAVGVDFGRAVGVLPIASDDECRGYRHLEHLLLFDTGFHVVVEPIETIVKSGARGSFKSGSEVRSDPYLIVGVDRSNAERELRVGSFVPRPQRGRPGSGIVAPLRPPAEIPSTMSIGEWTDLSHGDVGERHLRDLKRAVVDGNDIDLSEDASEDEITMAIHRLRAIFELDARPTVVYRGALKKRDGRELVWFWGVVAWPDGRRIDLGPYLSRAALIEAIDSVASAPAASSNPPWSAKPTQTEGQTR